MNRSRKSKVQKKEKKKKPKEVIEQIIECAKKKKKKIKPKEKKFSLFLFLWVSERVCVASLGSCASHHTRPTPSPLHPPPSRMTSSSSWRHHQYWFSSFVPFFQEVLRFTESAHSDYALLSSALSQLKQVRKKKVQFYFFTIPK